MDSVEPLPDADLRGELRLAMRLMHEWGLLGGARSGNASARVIEAHDAWLVTPTRAIKPMLRDRDVLAVGPAGGPFVTEDWPLHLALYQAFPDAGAVLHGHLPHATATLDGMADGAVLWADSVDDLIALLADRDAARPTCAMRGHGFWRAAASPLDALADLDMVEARARARWIEAAFSGTRL